MSSQKQKNRRVEVGGGGPPKLPFDNSTRTQSASVGSVDGEGEGADREQYREFYLPQVQRLIIMVLMRSRCSRVRQREGEGGGWRSEVWPVQGEPTWRSCPGIPKSPSHCNQHARSHVLISTQQVLLANTENCLPQWFTEPLWTLAMPKGYWDITVVMNDLNLWGTSLFKVFE